CILRASSANLGPTYSAFFSTSARSLRSKAMSSRRFCASAVASGLATAISFDLDRLGAMFGAIKALAIRVELHCGQETRLRFTCLSKSPLLLNQASNVWLLWHCKL